MGRHSVPDEIADDTVDSTAATASLPTVFTELDRPGAESRPAADSPSAPGPVGKLVDAAVSPTRADVNLLKAVPGLRAQALAAIVVPYLLYTVILVLLARTDVFLVWLWIPTVLAGALVGHLLDRAHSSMSSASGER